MIQRERQWHPAASHDGVMTPAGAYSPAVRAGDFVFVSGQVPRDPATGALAGDGIEEQTKQVITNVEGALEAAGASLADVVSVTVYLADIDDWDGFNTLYKKLMPAPYASRTTVGANLRGIRIEVSAVAYAPAPRDA